MLTTSRIMAHSVMWEDASALQSDASSLLVTLGVSPTRSQTARTRFMHTVMASGGWSNRRLALIAGIGVVVVAGV